MARKKKRWRDREDPADIFGGERTDDGQEHASDPAYDAFRRHIEEHIQGETRAFHELRSTAEHELQAAAIVTSPSRKIPPPKKAVTMEPPRPAAGVPASAGLPTPSRVVPKNSNGGSMIMMGLIFTTVGFLLHSAWQQTQSGPRKASLSAKSKLAADGPCAADKPVGSRKVANSSMKNPVIVPPPPVESMTAAALPPPAPTPPPTIEPPAAGETILKGLSLRAVELRRGPGTTFEIVDSLPPGFALEGVLTTDRQWLRVKPGAFVSADAVQFQDPAAAGYQSFWVGQNIANIREFPLTTARVLRKADPGSELKLQAFNGEWSQVSGGGFVFRKLVTSEAPRLLQLPAIMRVTVERAEIRGGPGQQYPVLGLYFRNHKVEAQEIQGAWLRVGPDQYIKAQEMELSVKTSSDKTM